MPLHVKVVCIGLNILTALVIGLIAIFTFFDHKPALSLFFTVWAATAGYSAYEMDKVRRYLNEQAARRGELQVVDLKDRLNETRKQENGDG